MPKEFNLSNCIYYDKPPFILVGHIKEFIKRLKEEFDKEWDGEGKCPDVNEITDKLAGDKLT